MRRQIQMVRRGVHGKPRRPRIEMQCGAARFAVEPGVFEGNVGGAKQFAGAGAAAAIVLVEVGTKGANLDFAPGSEFILSVKSLQ